MTRTVPTGKRDLWAKLTDLDKQELHPTRRTPCGDEDPEVVFPFRGDVKGIAKAKAICRSTPVAETAAERRAA